MLGRGRAIKSGSRTGDGALSAVMSSSFHIGAAEAAKRQMTRLTDFV